MNRTQQKQSLNGKPKIREKAEWLKLSSVVELIEVGSNKLSWFMKRDFFEVRDFRGPNARRPEWRISRRSLDAFIKSRPLVRYSEHARKIQKAKYCHKKKRQAASTSKK